MTDVENLLKGEACSAGPVHFQEKSDDLKFVAIVKHTVGYIVGAIVFSEDKSEILLVQEAKARCRGLWYFPVGRLEARETLVQGVKREVKEEAGVDFTPTKLLCLEATEGDWFRFTFTGEISGELKSVADDDSMKAAWAPINEVLHGDGRRFPLRKTDFLPLVLEKQKEVSCYTLPSQVPHTKLLMRLLFTIEYNQKYFYLETNGRLPVVRIRPYKSLRRPILRFTEMVFDVSVPYKIVGVLGVEHSAHRAGTSDGMCISLLVHHKPGARKISTAWGPDSPVEVCPEHLVPLSHKAYTWCAVAEADDGAGGGGLHEWIAHKLHPENTVTLAILE